MKKIIIVLMILFFANMASAEDYLLKYDAVIGATGYKVYFTDGTSKFQKDVGDVTQYNLNDLNIEPDIKYTYQVTAYNESVESEPSVALDFTRPVYKPGADSLPTYVIKVLNNVTITITQE